MRYKITTLNLFILLFCSCDVPAPGEVFDNPLDIEVAEEEGLETPALVFFPDSVTVSTGSNVSVQIFVMEVENLRGSYIEMSYNKNLVSVLSINAGDFFADATETIFITDNDLSTGTLEIYTSFVGSDTLSVAGTGSLVNVVFSTLSTGRAALSYASTCELVDQDDVPITIKGFGKGVIHAQ